MEMLRYIAQHPLPLTIESAVDVDKVRVLRAAGLVAALFIKGKGVTQDTQSARVLAVTPAGRAALAAHGDAD